MPARRAFAPWTVPFHLPRFTLWRLAPYRKVGRVAFAIYLFNPALSVFGLGAGQRAVVGDGRCVEIKAAVEFVAMLVGNAGGIGNHCRDIIRCNRPMGGLTDVQRLDIGPIGLGIMARDIPDGLRLFGRHLLHLVFAGIGIVGQMADIGNVNDVGELVALIRQHPPQRVGKDIRAHVADMRIIINRRPARIHARFTRMHRYEGFQLPGQAVEEFKLGHRLAMLELGAEVKSPRGEHVQGCGVNADLPRYCRGYTGVRPISGAARDRQQASCSAGSWGKDDERCDIASQMTRYSPTCF